MPQISDYLYQKASAKKIPLGGAFELSPVCNFACKMCYVRKTPEQIARSGKRLKGWTEWLELAKQCREEGTLYLLLTGGEPFLYPHFRELYMQLHQMGFILSINSNGTMIDRETVEWLKTAAPSRVNITLYGASAETYERICGNPDGYVRAANAIRMLKDAGIPVVINASMIPENACDLESIIHFGRELELNTRMSTYMFPPVRREAEESDSRFTPEVSAEMFLRKQRCLMNDIQYRDMLHSQLKKMQDKQQLQQDDWGNEGEYMRCRAGRSSFWVSWEGEMTACGMLPFPLQTDPFSQPFRDCWLALTNTVRTTQVLHECAHCEKKEICRPCVAMLYAEAGNVNRKAPYLCRLADCIVSSMKHTLQEMEVSENAEKQEV